MPASERSLALTDAYRRQLLSLRQRAIQIVQRLWSGLSPEDLQATYERWLGGSGAVLTGAQRQGVDLTAAYLTAYLAAELGPTPPTTLAADSYVEPDPTQKLLPPLFTIKLAMLQRRPEAEALQMGFVRATRTIAVEAMRAPRAALADQIREDDRITGYRRVTSQNPCGACLAEASGDIEPPTEQLHLHAHCRCTAEPVTKARERFRRPSGQEIFNRLSTDEQNALFLGRGGAEKADLIRSGLPLSALSQPQPMADETAQITETPLAALTPTA